VEHGAFGGDVLGGGGEDLGDAVVEVDAFEAGADEAPA
jgi:hypothetical protein